MMLSLLFAAAIVGETLTGPAVALDGDTLFMVGATGEPKRVRLFGIDTPEMGTPLGPIARAALDDLIADQEVTCVVVDVDSRGRAVASCEVAAANLSEAVLREGLGTAYRIFTYAAGADLDLAQRFDTAEAAARAEGLGIWATATAESAWWQDFRWWQMMVSAGTAFAGFFVATRYNHSLTMKRLQAERDAAQSDLAAELHAELPWVMKTVRRTIATIGNKYPADVSYNGSVEANRIEWRQWRPAPMPVLESHIGELGVLPHAVANDLISLDGRATFLRELSDAFSAEMEEHEFDIAVAILRGVVIEHKLLVPNIVRLNQSLAELAGTVPYTWRKLDDYLPPADADTGEDDPLPPDS